MPTNLDRIQTLLQPDAYAKVRTLAKHNRRALSAMSAELVEEALKLPKYRQQIEDAEVQVPVKEDSRGYAPQTAIRKEERLNMSDYYKGLKAEIDDEELEDLIPVETSDDQGLEGLTPEKIKELQALLAMLAKQTG